MIDSGEMEKIYESKDTVMYRTSCSCCSDEDLLTIDLENDDGFKTATFYHKNQIKGWYLERKDADNWKEYFEFLLEFIWKTIKYRVTTAAKILFTGWAEYEGGFTFRGDRQILNVAEALIDLVRTDPDSKK